MASDTTDYDLRTSPKAGQGEYQYTLNLLGKTVRFTIPAATGPLDPNGTPFLLSASDPNAHDPVDPLP